MLLLNNFYRNSCDLIELVLLPGIAALLPWRWCFWLFDKIAYWPWLYYQQTENNRLGAQTMGLVVNRKKWDHDYRLIQLVDHADLYLSMFRSDKWMDHYIAITDEQWAKKRPVLILGFHWGAGLWIFRYLRQQGIQAAPLFGSVDDTSLATQPIRRWYYRMRVKEVERGSGTSALFTGYKNVRRLLETFAQEQSVLALMDVPPDGATPCLPGYLLHKPAGFPKGLIKLAVTRKITVMSYQLAINRQNGQRLLHIHGPLPTHNEYTLVTALNDLLNQALIRDPSAWHFWAFIDQFLNAPIIKDNKTSL